MKNGKNFRLNIGNNIYKANYALNENAGLRKFCTVGELVEANDFDLVHVTDKYLFPEDMREKLFFDEVDEKSGEFAGNYHLFRMKDEKIERVNDEVYSLCNVPGFNKNIGLFIYAFRIALYNLVHMDTNDYIVLIESRSPNIPNRYFPIFSENFANIYYNYKEEGGECSIIYFLKDMSVNTAKMLRGMSDIELLKIFEDHSDKDSWRFTNNSLRN